MLDLKAQMDDLMKTMGERGRFQIVIHLLLAFTYVSILFNHVAMAFYGIPVPHTCEPEPGEDTNEWRSISTGSCSSVVHWNDGRNESVTCSPGQFKYSPDMEERNIATEFDLVCDDQSYVSLATTIYFAGVMLGGLVFGDLSDRFGRKPVVLTCLYGSIVIGLITAFSVNYTMFVILRFVNGILMQGLQTSYVMIMELYRPEYRPFAGSIPECFFGCAVMIMAGLAYFLRYWRHLQIAISVIPAVTFFYICVLPESLRWLIAKGKLDKAEQLIARICRVNKLPYPEDTLKQLRDQNGQKTDTSPTTVNLNMTYLFRTPKLRKRTLVHMFIWLATSTCYYGVTYKVARFNVNRYLLFFIGGAVEAIVYACGIPIMNFFGRKKPLICAFITAGLMCISSGFVNDYAEGADQLTAILALVGRCALALVFGIIFVYTSELYPTIIRNIGLGFACFWARAGGVLAPQINQWGREVLGLDAIIVFGVFSFLAGILVLLLEETHNTKLPDSIGEVESLTQSVDDLSMDALGKKENGGGELCLEPGEDEPLA